MGKKSVRERFLSFMALILFAVFSSYTGKLSAGELDPEPLPEPKTYLIQINARGTYFSPPTKCFDREDGSQDCDVYQAPTRFSLLPMMQDENFPLKRGDFIKVEALGAFDLDGPCTPDGSGCGSDEAHSGVLAVFHGPSGFLFPGPEGTAGGLVSAWGDIPQDFILDMGAPEWIQVPEGATDLQFSPNDDFFKDNYDSNADYQVVAVTVVSCVKRVKVELSKDEVLPLWESGTLRTWKRPQIEVKATVYCANDPDPDPKLITGIGIDFLDVPVKRSGGHDHEGKRPTGEFDKDAHCKTESSGSCAVKYTPPEIGGKEEIYAGLSEDDSINDMKELKVAVPDLIFMGRSSLWNLGGDRPDTFHRDNKNHYVSRKILSNLSKIASDFLMETKAKLVMNDASLPNGGLFDIGPVGNNNWHFWEHPHWWHREGLGIDIERCAVSTIKNNPLPRNGSYTVKVEGQVKVVNVHCGEGKIFVSKDVMIRICESWDGQMVNEATHHCEFGVFK